MGIVKIALVQLTFPEHTSTSYGHSSLQTAD